MNAQRGGREKNNQDAEVYVNLKVSSLLRNRVCVKLPTLEEKII